jgi:hypothetical protein
MILAMLPFPMRATALGNLVWVLGLRSGEADMWLVLDEDGKPDWFDSHSMNFAPAIDDLKPRYLLGAAT